LSYAEQSKISEAKPAKELAYPNAPTKDNAAKNEQNDRRKRTPKR